MSNREFTPEQIAKGLEVTKYYSQLDINDLANQPTDNETVTVKPIKQMIDEAGNV